MKSVGVIKVTAIARQPEKILVVEIFLNQDLEILAKNSKASNRRKRCARTTFQHNQNILFWLYAVLSRCMH